jgi:hypothetical protein
VSSDLVSGIQNDGMNDLLIVDPRIPRASRRTAAIPAGVTLELEYLAVSLSEPRRRYGILTI